VSVRQRLAAWRAASRARTAKRQAEGAARVRELKGDRERWALALEMIDHVAARYGSGHPGGPRALRAYLRRHLADYCGSPTKPTGADPVHTLEEAVQDMFGRAIAWEREQAMRAMDEQKRDDAEG
jgi:hypothetical protein